MPRASNQEYTRDDVLRMLGMSERQLRGWEKSGLIPTGPAFSFSDLIALKTLQKLREKRVPARKIGNAIQSLKRKLSHVERPLSELKIISDGRTISVLVAGQKMEAISGQMLFDFDTSDLPSLKSFPSPSAPTVANQEAEAERVFQRGLMLEETGAPVQQAIDAYQKAVQLNPQAAGALVNLGTIFYRLKKLKDAESHYRRAVEADPEYPLAHFNLANLYDEQQQAAPARHHYQAALRLNATYADAHFNLALLCERTGDTMNAVSHWKAYLKLDATSTWAGTARRQLERLTQVTLVKPR